MPWTRTFALAVPLVLAVALGACGDDDDAAGEATGVPVTTDGVAETVAAEVTTASTGSTAATTATDVEPTTSGSSEGDDEVCGPMRALAEYNASDTAIDDATDWAGVQEALETSFDDAIALYDDAIAVAPDEIRDQLEELKAFSEEGVTVAIESETPDEFQDFIEANAEDLQQPTLELDGWLRENCGFGLTTG